ncbi:MAG: hypothetical protein MEEGG_01644 [Eggerthella lenta]
MPFAFWYFDPMAWFEPPRLMGLLLAENTMTSAPCSAADTAVHNPAMPAPTTTMSCVMVSAMSASATGSGGISKLHFICW